MIKIASNPSYTAPCTFTRPIDGGQVETITFMAKFRRQTQDQVEEIYNRFTGGEKNVVRTTAADAQLVHEVMCGWDGVGNQDGESLEFNATNLGLLLNEHGARAAIVRSFFESIQGAAAKN
ncbi:phage tail assembly chaperone [Pseudoduganella sp. RAF53_2]|uniref:phage tail assembly chaperone n=1 Tax=unclassified Pseudoduganella TaxID=2637179 RepID=UPI003F94418F